MHPSPTKTRKRFLVVVFLLVILPVACLVVAAISLRLRLDQSEHLLQKWRLLCGDIKSIQKLLSGKRHNSNIRNDTIVKESVVDDWNPNLAFGNYTMPITFEYDKNKNRQTQIQKAFDRGLMECYGFAFFEARKTARTLLRDMQPTAAAEQQPLYWLLLYCPMCYWLLAMGHSPYINHPILQAKSDYESATQAATQAYLQARRFRRKVRPSYTFQEIPRKFASKSALFRGFIQNVNYGEKFRLSYTGFKDNAGAASWEEFAGISDNEQSPTAISFKELALIDALYIRYTQGSFENQTLGNELYKQALWGLHKYLLVHFGKSDADIMAFLADAIMVMHCDEGGYNFYDDDTSLPKPEIAKAIDLLRDCLKDVPNHPLCQHLFIHITEPSPIMAPTAEAVADHLLADTTTKNKKNDAQHLQHMPSHSYLRIGRYHDAVRSNIVAHATDQRYEHHGAVAYGVAHNLVILVHAARLSGEKALALQYSNTLREHYKRVPNRPDGPGTEVGWHVWRTIRLAFGEFAEILEDTDEIPGGKDQSGPVSWPYALVLGHYAKGIASLWNNDNPNIQERWSKAEHHFQKLMDASCLVDDDSARMATVAKFTLQASIQYFKIQHYDTLLCQGITCPSISYIQKDKHRRMRIALAGLRMARKEQEQWKYTEPPDWYSSLWLCEGTLLRIMGRYEEAKDAFTKDLTNLPENRLGLYGLWKTLQEGGTASDDQVQNVRDRFEKASSWTDASVKENPPLVCPELGE